MNAHVEYGSDKPMMAAQLDYKDMTLEDVDEMERLFLLWTRRLRATIIRGDTTPQ